MTNAADHETQQNPGPAYESPCALRLGNTRGAAGAEEPPCLAPGSSATGDCMTGFAAAIMCFQTGNSADKCDGPGNAATQDD